MSFEELIRHRRPRRIDINDNIVTDDESDYEDLYLAAHARYYQEAHYYRDRNGLDQEYEDEHGNEHGADYESEFDGDFDEGIVDYDDSHLEFDDKYEYDDYSDSEYGVSAQEQWEESIKQITGLVNFVLFPVVGKLLGRRTAHFLWLRFANWLF